MNTTYNWIVKRPETAAAIQEAVKAGTCTTPDHVVAIAVKYGDEVFWAGAIPWIDNRAKDIDTVVADILREIGVPARILGYQYVCEAIKLTLQDRSMVQNITKVLYPTVAKKFDTTGSCAERAIRHAVEVAWDRGDLEKLQKYFGYTVSAAKGKPTNGEFIAMLADHIARGTAA